MIRPWQKVIKNLIDYGVAALSLLFLSPFFLLIGLLIKLDSRGPVFFRQERVGEGGRVFTMFKFRTMVQNASMVFKEDGSTLAEGSDPRITRVGRFLRHFLDELPQVINILRGEMSLVGPRPDLPFQVETYSPEERKKLLAKPGLTNLPAVSGRNDLPWRERIAMDIWYIEHYSLRLDLKILILTALLLLGVKVRKGDGDRGGGDD